MLPSEGPLSACAEPELAWEGSVLWSPCVGLRKPCAAPRRPFLAWPGRVQRTFLCSKRTFFCSFFGPETALFRSQGSLLLSKTALHQPEMVLCSLRGITSPWENPLLTWNALYWHESALCWSESALFRSRETLCRLERILCRYWDDLPSALEGRLST